jgi:hypothetical protein
MDADLTLEMRGDSFTARGPMTLRPASGNPDVVNVDAKASLGDTTNFGIHARADSLNSDALTAFALAFKPALASPTATAPSTPPTPDTQPLWAGLSGTATAIIGNLTARGIAFQNATVDLALEPLALRIARAELSHAGKPVAASGALEFIPGQPASPYRASGKLTTQGFDVGAFLAAQEPGQEPKLRTIADVEATFQAVGATLGALVDNPMGQVKLRGTQGTFRALGSTGRLLESISKNFDTVERGAGVVSQAVGLAGALGLLRGEDANRAANVAAQAQQRIAEGKRYRDLVEFLATMPFDEFSLDAALGANRQVEIRQLDFLSNVIRMGMTGSTSLAEGQSWRQLPVNLALAMQARGSLADLLPKDRFLAQEGSEWVKLAQPLSVNGNLETALQQQLTSTLLPALLGR